MSKKLKCRICSDEVVEVAETSLSVVCYKCTSKLVNGQEFDDEYDH
tara:strand:+ start:24626 stop:24763 length:138 start_codon:yes stop_codon:yes gene_type:complete